MIYNRTQADIDNAKKIRKDKISKFLELTEEEKEIVKKGFLTIDTLNRIEGKTNILKELFEEDKYFPENISVKIWDYSNIFKQDEFDRIVENVKKLMRAYFVYDETPKIPDNNYRKYQTINAIEKILYDLDVMISDIKSHYRECGAYECGGDEV